MALVQSGDKVTVFPTLLITRRSKKYCQILGSSGTEQVFPTVKVSLPKSFSFSKTSVTFVEEGISTILGLGESRLEVFTSHDSLGILCSTLV